MEVIDMHNDTSTLTVEAITPYAQVPKWVLRSGDKLSHGAVRLYGAIMSYADNINKTAFPGKDKLATDLGTSSRSIYTYMKELEAFGALKITHRRKQGSGNFASNHYTLIFRDPSEAQFPPPSEPSFPISKPSNYLDPDSYTVNSEESTGPFHDDTHVPPRDSHNTMAGMTQAQRTRAIRLIQYIGKLISQGHSMHDDELDDPIGQLYTHMEESTQQWEHHDELLDQLNNGFWTFSPKEANPYNAGKKLNKMLNTVAVTP